jgi:hypothetical protein
VYHYVALYPTYTIVRGVLFCVAVTFWVLYLHEVLFRSGRIQTQWVKKGLADLALLTLHRARLIFGLAPPKWYSVYASSLAVILQQV